MSTIGIESWAVDLNDVGAMYPFQGTEVVMVVAAVAFWIVWHVLQMRQESAEIAEVMLADQKGDKARALIDEY
jgi:hypothetical protein